jgi:hypothetical protein
MLLLSGFLLLSANLAAAPDIVWQKEIDIGSTDKAHGMAFSTVDSALVIAAEAGDLPQDILVYKLSMGKGDSVWARTLDNDGVEDIGTDVAVAPNGTVFVGATTKPETDPKMFVCACSKSGSLLWENTSNFPAEHGSPSLACRHPDSCYLADWYGTSSDTYPFGYLFKEDGSYSLLWQGDAFKAFALSDIDINDKGELYAPSSPLDGIRMNKRNAKGENIWDKAYEEPSVILRGWACRVAPTQDVYLCGERTKTNTDFLLLKWSPSGIQLFDPAKLYDLGENEFCRDIAVDSISDCYLAGWQLKGEDENLVLVKVDSEGNLLWSWIDTMPGNQEIEALEIDSEGYLYLAGSTQTGTDWDALVMKVRQPLTVSGIVKDSTGTPMKDFVLTVSGDTALEAITGDDGRYSIELYNGGDYTLKPKQSGWLFEPAQYSYSPLAHRMMDQDFLNGRWTGVKENDPVILASIQLSGTVIYYTLDKGQHGFLSIFDALGRRVECFEVKGSGQVNFKSILSTGVYFVVLKSCDLLLTQKMVMLK